MRYTKEKPKRVGVVAVLVAFFLVPHFVFAGFFDDIITFSGEIKARAESLLGDLGTGSPKTKNVLLSAKSQYSRFAEVTNHTAILVGETVAESFERSVRGAESILGVISRGTEEVIQNTSSAGGKLAASFGDPVPKIWESDSQNAPDVAKALAEVAYSYNTLSDVLQDIAYESVASVAGTFTPESLPFFFEEREALVDEVEREDVFEDVVVSELVALESRVAWTERMKTARTAYHAFSNQMSELIGAGYERAGEFIASVTFVDFYPIANRLATPFGDRVPKQLWGPGPQSPVDIAREGERFADGYRELSEGVSEGVRELSQTAVASVADSYEVADSALVILSSGTAAVGDSFEGLADWTREKLRTWLGIGSDVYVASTTPTVIVKEPTQPTIVERFTERIISNGTGISSTELDNAINLAINNLRDELNPRIDRAMVSPRNLYRSSGGGSSVVSGDYLELTGGTLTGALTGTDATFSGALVAATGAFDEVTVTGSTTLNGVEYLFPSADGASSTVLTTDGAGGLTWVAASGGITSINGLSDAVQTFATSSDTNIGLTITSAAGTHTFTTAWSGVLSIARGGTGTSTAPSFGQVLLGNASGGYDLVATSSLGFLTFSDMAASLENYLSLADWYATTTDGLDEGVSNLYYTDQRVSTYVTASSTIPKGTPTLGNILLGNGSAWTSVGTSSLGLGTIVGSTGATDNVFLMSDGTGGSTLQAGPLSFDEGSSKIISTYEINIGTTGTQGFYKFATNSLGVRGTIGSVSAITQSSNVWKLNSTEVGLANGAQLKWYQGLTSNTTADTGLTRSSAGILKVTDGSTGLGALEAGYLMASSTAATSTFAGSLFATKNVLFQNSADSTTGFQVLDADGGVPILSVDTTNERLGIGVSAPSNTLSVIGPSPGGVIAGFGANSTENLITIGYDTGTAVSSVTGSSFGRFDVKTQGNNNLILDPGSGYVGIATTTPAYKLTVDGGALFYGGLTVESGPLVTDDVTVGGDILMFGRLYDPGLSSGSNGDVLVSTGTGVDWVATSTLGISGGASLFTDGGDFTYLTSTTDSLVLGSNASSTALFWFDVDSATAYIGNGGAGDSTITLGPDGNVWSVGYDATDGSFAIASSTALGTNNALTILQNANIGIGTTTPEHLFVVAGTSSFRDVIPEANLTYNLGSSANRWKELWAEVVNVGTSTWSILNSDNGRLSFFDQASGGGSELFTILPNGNVGIGTTTPDYSLTVVGTTYFSEQLTTGAVPTGTGVNEGVLYVNPPSYSSASLVEWTVEPTWYVGSYGAASYPSPELVDLDNDGDLDLVNGLWNGTGDAYENTGSNLAPTWSANASWDLPDVGAYNGVTFGDLDNDGDLDAMSSNNGGIIYGIENVGSASSPSWSLNASWNTGDTGTNSKPELADLDDDGDLDLLVGDSNGVAKGYENTGSILSPSWAAKGAWNTPDAGGSANPTLADLDNDGDLDLIVGTSAGTGVAYRNIGTVSSPVWTAYSSWDLPDIGVSSAPAFGDLDGDGDEDVIFADANGPVYGYKNTGSMGSAENTLFGVAVSGAEQFKVSGEATYIQGYLDLNNFMDLVYNGNQAALSVRQNGQGNLLDVLDGSDTVFTIKDGGNVGIGTTTPLNKLDVAGSINIDKNASYKQNGQTILYASSTNYATFVGMGAGQSVVSSATGNTALGYEALFTATSSSDNTAIGYGALRVDTSTGRNTAVGALSLYLNTYGAENTAIGWQSLALNTTGSQNASLGAGSLGQNDDGSSNVAIGSYALADGTSPDSNVAVGANALKALTTGTGNVAVGYSAGWDSVTVNQRSAIDEYMTFLGYGASRDSSISNAVALSKSVAIGYNARVATSSAIVLGGTGADAVTVGIGTTTPTARLHVVGDTILDGSTIRFGSSTAATLNIDYAAAATSTIANNVLYAWTIATSTTDTPIVWIDTRSGGSMATTSIEGGFSVNSGAILYDYASNITSIENLNLGNMSFDDNAGTVSWINLPITAGPVAGTVESYSAQIDDTAVLTVYGESDGSGGVQNTRVGIGSSTPSYKLSIAGTVGVTGLTTSSGTPDALCWQSTGEVTVNTGSQTCTVSSLRFKHAVEDIDIGLDTVNALRAASFMYNDATSTPRIGLIAEEVEQVDARLIFYEADGVTPRGVRYEDIVALLVKAVQELSVKVDAALAAVGAGVSDLVATFKEVITDKLTTKELCLEDVCITKTELEALLESADTAPASSGGSSGGAGGGGGGSSSGSGSTSDGGTGSTTDSGDVNGTSAATTTTDDVDIGTTTDDGGGDTGTSTDEEPPAEEPVVEEPLVEEPPAEDLPTDEPPVEEEPAQEPAQ